MRLLRKITKYDKAVYWPYAGQDEFSRPVYGTAVEIDVRWEETGEVFKNDDGEETVSRAKVFSDIDLTKGGVLWHGRLADVASATAPFDNPDAWEIARFQKIPTLKYDDYARIAYL